MVAPVRLCQLNLSVFVSWHRATIASPTSSQAQTCHGSVRRFWQNNGTWSVFLLQSRSAAFWPAFILVFLEEGKPHWWKTLHTLGFHNLNEHCATTGRMLWDKTSPTCKHLFCADRGWGHTQSFGKGRKAAEATSSLVASTPPPLFATGAPSPHKTGLFTNGCLEQKWVLCGLVASVWIVSVSLLWHFWHA